MENLKSTPARTEIDQHTIKLIVGVIAISLPFLTSALTNYSITSISASYHEGGWPRNIFVGFLFAIAAFLLAYNGKSGYEMLMSKIAAFAAVGVAMFPCGCDVANDLPSFVPVVHYVSAIIMFVILALFCYSFYKRARRKGHSRAILRSYIYALCGLVIVGSMVAIAVGANADLGEGLLAERLVFYGEAVALIAFGVAWLTASRIVPVITDRDERLHLNPFR